MATVDPLLPVSDDALPMLPADAAPAAPSIAEQKRQHAADNPPPSGDGDQLPMAPVQQPPLMNSSWSQIGKRLWDEGTRGVGLGTRATVEGLTSLPGMALDAVTWPGRAIQRAVGIPTDAPSTLVQKGLDATGLPTPQTPTEKNVSTIVGGAASALPGMAIGAAPTVANAIRLGIQGGAGAIAGQKAAESDLVPQWAKPEVAMAAAMLGGKAADVAGNLGVKGINALAGNTSDIYNAFQRLGIDTRLVGTVGGGEAGASAEAAFSRVPFASSAIRPVQQKTVDQFGNAVDNTALRLDPNLSAVSPQATGTSVQAAARDWRDNVFPAQQKALWDPLNQRMAGAAVTPSGYQSALDSVTKQLGLPETQKALTPALAQKLSDALSADVGGNMTWDQASALRTLIGQTMGVPEISQSVGADVLKRAYAGIASDMRNTAVAHGQDALFDAANKVSTDGHAFINGPLAKVISTNNPAQERITPDQATSNLLNSDGTTLQAIRDNLPGAADQLAAYKLRQMATAKPSVATAYDDTSTGTYLSNANRMRQNQPGAYDALYQDPAVRQQLDDLSTVAGRLRMTEKHLNTSGTAEQLAWMEYLRNIGEAVSEGSVRNTLGAMTLPPTVGRLGGKLLTSPTLTRFAAGQGAGPPAIPPSAGGLLGAAPQLAGYQ